MKKIFILLTVMMSLSASAQTQDKDIQKMQSSVSIEWDKPKGEDNVIRLDFVYKHLLVGGSYIIGSGGNETQKDSKGFDLHLGGNYRYFLGNKGMFYVEGRMMAYYSYFSQKKLTGTHTVIHHSGFGNREKTHEEVNEIWKTEKTGEGFGLSITPRIGFQKNGYSVYAGVGWNFLSSDVKLKNINFDKEFEGYYFTVGLAKLF